MTFAELDKKFAEEFFGLVEESSAILITSHISPDPDSVSSVLAMYSLLSERYPTKSIRMIYSGEPIKDYAVFKNFEKIEFLSDISEQLDTVDLLIMLDGAQYYRFTKSPEKVEKFKGQMVCIDHHSSPPDKFAVSLIMPNISSCAEILYRAFLKDQSLSKDLAKTLLLGILADTGNFSFLKPSQTETLLIAKNLLDIAQVQIDELQMSYSSIPKRILPILAELTKNTQCYDIHNWPGFVSSFVSREFVTAGKYTDNEVGEAKALYTSFFVRKIEGYPWGFVIVPRENGDCRISFRSLVHSVSVLNISQKMGLGGGHVRAAGGTFKHDSKALSPTDCLGQVLDWIKANQPLIV